MGPEPAVPYADATLSVHKKPAQTFAARVDEIVTKIKKAECQVPGIETQQTFARKNSTIKHQAVLLFNNPSSSSGGNAVITVRRQYSTVLAKPQPLSYSDILVEHNLTTPLLRGWETC